MDKAQALHNFWSSFGLPAYDSTIVLADEASMPYITYEVQTDSIDGTLALSASLWYYSMSWEAISKKAEEISQYINNMDPPAVKIDGGRMYVTRRTPFAQRMGDENRNIRRIVLGVNVEFLTED